MRRKPKPKPKPKPNRKALLNGRKRKLIYAQDSALQFADYCF